MSLSTDSLLKAFALISREPELLRCIEEMNLHFAREDLFSYPAEAIPGAVLRWLHCYADLELWHEGFLGRPGPSDVETALDLAQQLEELGVEATDERPCHDCDYRNRCL